MINLQKIVKIDDPYPIVIVENFFSEEFLNKLVQEFPKKNEFIKFKKTMVNRRVLSNDNPDFYNYINTKYSWKNFYNRINNKEFYKEVLRLLLDKNSSNNHNLENLKFHVDFYKKSKFAYNLTFYLKEIAQKIPKNNFFNFLRKLTKNIIYKKKIDNGNYLRFDISAASNGYYREAHTDSDGTIFAFLIYLEDQLNIGGSGGNFVIHDAKLNIFQSIEPKKNKALFFLSNKSSYHSVSKIVNATGWRKFIYGGFTSIDKNFSIK